MKKIIALPAAIFLFVAAANAQTDEAGVKQEGITHKEKREERRELRKLEGREVSYQAKEEFYKDFGNIPVINWEHTDNYDEASFMKDGHAYRAFYDFDAKLVGTTTHVSFSDIPENAQKLIDKKFGNYEKKDVVLFDDNELNDTDMFLYGQQFDDEDTYFVELQKDTEKIVLMVDMHGDVQFFKKLS